MEDLKKQLEEANKLIESHIKGPLSVTGEWFDYQKQYLTPVDPLKEKFGQFIEITEINYPLSFDFCFNTFKKTFKEELNATKALDRIIDFLRDYLSFDNSKEFNNGLKFSFEYMEQIKKELEA